MNDQQDNTKVRHLVLVPVDKKKQQETQERKAIIDEVVAFAKRLNW